MFRFNPQQLANPASSSSSQTVKRIGQYAVGKQFLILEERISGSDVSRVFRLFTTQLVDAPAVSLVLDPQASAQLEKLCQADKIDTSALIASLQTMGPSGVNFAKALEHLLSSEALEKEFFPFSANKVSLALEVQQVSPAPSAPQSAELTLLIEERATMLELMKKGRGFHHSNVEKQFDLINERIRQCEEEQTQQQKGKLEL